MEILEKISILGAASKFDLCASSASNRTTQTNDRIGNAASCGICHSFTPDGRCVSLYKTLMSNSCTFDCKYCGNSTSCNKKTASFSPDELAKTFMSLYVRNYVEGLFLSSGVVKDPNYTTEKMIESVNLIRNKYKFKGYIHFKIIPGTSQELIKQAGEFSDRMSINLEAPSASRMKEISDIKDYKIDILRRQRWIKLTSPVAGQTTQLVVGSSDETDLEVLRMVDWEYKNMNLKRGYYSGFTPVKKTPLEFKDKTPLLREHRLYNIDFMMRKYHMPLKEFKSIMDDGMLPKEDPKLALARITIGKNIDINEADFNTLIRIPGIGPQSAERILNIRKNHEKITKREQLHSIGVVLKRAEPFIKINGKSQTRLSAFT